MVEVRVEELSALDPSRVGALVAEGRAAGFRFLDRLIDEWASAANRFDGPGEVLLAAVSESGALVGVCGLNVDPFLGDPSTARLRHLYVRVAHRRRGIARGLVRRLVENARAAAFMRIRLRTDSPDAARLYAALGFLRCDSSPSATHVLLL